MFDGIGYAVAAFFNFWTTKADPEKNMTAYQLALLKKKDKAIEAGEAHIRGTESYFNKKISKNAFKYLHQKYSKKFFENNN
jgi:hypothetical protein